MCKSCGNCSKEHTRTIDDAIDASEPIGWVRRKNA